MIRGWNPIRCTVASPSSSLVSYMDQIEGPRDLTEVISEQLREVQLTMPGVTASMLVLIEFMRNPDWAQVYSLFFVSRLWNSMDKQRWLLILILKQHVVNTVFIRSATTFLSSLAGRLFRTLVLKVRIVKDPATEISDCHQRRTGSTHTYTHFPSLGCMELVGISTRFWNTLSHQWLKQFGHDIQTGMF